MKQAEAKIGKIVFARLSENEDLLEMITEAAVKAKVSTGFFQLIGTLKTAKLGFFREGKYETVEMKQPLEIVSCVGNISVKEGKAFAHAHIAVSDERGAVYGGHVMPGCLIGVTGELMLIQTKGIQLLRKFDAATKLSLLSFQRSASKATRKRPA